MRVRPIREVVKAVWASEEREGAVLIQEQGQFSVLVVGESLNNNNNRSW